MPKIILCHKKMEIKSKLDIISSVRFNNCKACIGLFLKSQLHLFYNNKTLAYNGDWRKYFQTLLLQNIKNKKVVIK